MSTFSLDLSNFKAKTEANFVTLIRDVVIETARQINFRSPVGDRDKWAVNIYRAAKGLPPVPKGYVGGHFRANNQYGYGSAPGGEIAGTDADGSATMAKIINGVKNSPAIGVHYIVNNAPYADILENGHSTQAPMGIYGLAAIDMQQIVNEEAAKMRAK